MKVLLLIAHGSRLEQANQEVRDLAERIARHDNCEYQAVVPAFLEFAQPDIGGGVDACVSLGATEIKALPYFLSAGAHVQRDLPKMLGLAWTRHPQIKIAMSQHFGSMELVPGALLTCAESNVDEPELS